MWETQSSEAASRDAQAYEYKSQEAAVVVGAAAPAAAARKLVRPSELGRFHLGSCVFDIFCPCRAKKLASSPLQRPRSAATGIASREDATQAAARSRSKGA